MASTRECSRKDGTVYWQVRWRENGTQTSLSFDDENLARRFEGHVDLDGPAAALRWLDTVQPSDDVITVDQLAEAYFTWKDERGPDGQPVRVRSDRTVPDYRRQYELWIAPTFGRLRIDDVTDQAVQRWVDKISTQTSPKSVAGHHGLLAAMYKWAMAPARGHAHATPCGFTELPKRVKKPPKSLRPGEWMILYQAASQVSPAAADVLLFLVGTGWRWSEMAALQVWQVEEEDGAMFVLMDQVARRNAAGQLVIVNDAKSEAGRGRRVRLSPLVAELVRRRITGKDLGEYVFTSPTGKMWRYNNFHQRYWTRPEDGKTGKDDRPRILERARELGLLREPTLHWLRHTHVVLLMKTGKVAMPEAQRRVGHESIQTTFDLYGSGIDDVNPDALKDLDAALSGKKTRRLRAVD